VRLPYYSRNSIGALRDMPHLRPQGHYQSPRLKLLRKMPSRAKSKPKSSERRPMTRSEVMSRVRSSNTKPELAVRRALWAAGFRYRLHDTRIPGRPDATVASRMLAIFVHGCFWHGHEGCPRHRIPKSRVEWWTTKIMRNKARDAEVRSLLSKAGWRIAVIWECQVEDATKLAKFVRDVAKVPLRRSRRHRGRGEGAQGSRR
jgi:DNA mismatch endonuclease (patch repair protein)